LCVNIQLPQQVSATKLRDAWTGASAYRVKAVKQKGKGLAASAVSAGGFGGGGGLKPALNTPGHWDFFISHTQKSGKATTLAAELYADLEVLTRANDPRRARSAYPDRTCVVL